MDKAVQIRKISDLEIIILEKIIGQGCFGEVREGLMSEEKVAIKSFKNQTTVSKEAAEKELMVMTQLKHKNIVNFIGIIDEFQKCPKLVFEFVENGALKDFVSLKSREEDTLIRLCYDISCGMGYLHDMQYIHRDLSARNVLVDSRERAKVADFGMCKFLDLDNSPEYYYYKVDAAKPCPLRWVPKEIIQVVTSRGELEGKFTFASDVWAFGVTMWEMWMKGAVPYMWLGKTMSNQDVCINIGNGKNPNSFDEPKNISAKILQIMEQIFQVDRKQRPKFSQLKVQLEMIIEERKEAQLIDSSLEGSKIDNKNIGICEKSEYILLDQTETGQLLSTNSSVSLAKWWPFKKNLILAMHLRRVGKQLLVEKLHEIIFSNRRRMVVICQSETATKFSGLGGVGKTLTAKWYAHHYENEYENIIWIDCGEDSLLQSFRNLAIDLDIPNRGEFNDAHDLARHCFKSLSDQKCLWIFDNVESYMGSEGIHAVLPSNPEKFCCLITSRSKENWGNETGFGEISTFELSVFNENESIEFLRNYLKKEAKGNEYQLKQMSELLGNLPLALQLAVATLNKGTMQLQDYIDRTSTKDAGNIINEKFDDYERTINKNMQISLEILQTEDYGNVAHEILMIFGYIRPDNVLSEFLRKVINVSFQDFQKAVDVLEKYCLVTKVGKQKMAPIDGFLDKLLQRKEVEVNLLSIHRLLQQVIRHNGKSSEKATIRKILNCNGFLDYKLVPFLFADEDLKMEFKKLKVKLSDQLYLEKLFAKKEFSQSVVVSRFIHQEVNNDASWYNYSLCLDRKGEVDESLKQFKQMLAKISPFNTESNDNVFQSGLIPLDSQPNYFNIVFHILHLIQSKKNALDFHEQEIHQKFGNELKLKFTLENLHGIFESLENCPMTHYFARIKEDTILIKFKPRGLFLDSQPKKLFIDAPQSIHFIDCSLVENIRLPMNLVELKLSKVRFTNKNGKGLYNLKFLSFIPKNVQIFAIGFCHFTIPWNAFAHVTNFYARECYIGIPINSTPVPARVTPQKLKLRCVTFISEGKALKELCLNDIFALHNMDELCILQRHEDTLLSLDFSKFASAKNVELVQTKIVNWGKGRVQRLSLQGVPLIQINQMRIIELECSYSSVDLSCVANSIEKLQISASRVVNLSGGNIEFPNLVSLYLLDVKVPLTCLSHFGNCRNLTKLTLRYSYKIQFPTKVIPKSVTDIEIQAGHPIQSFELEGDCVRELNSLVLEYIGFQYIIKILKTLKPKHLLVHSMPHVINESQLSKLIDSLETKIVTVLIRDTVDYYFKNGVREEITVDQFTTIKNMHFS